MQCDAGPGAPVPLARSRCAAADPKAAGAGDRPALLCSSIPWKRRGAAGGAPGVPLTSASTLRSQSVIRHAISRIWSFSTSRPVICQGRAAASARPGVRAPRPVRSFPAPPAAPRRRPAPPGPPRPCAAPYRRRPWPPPSAGPATSARRRSAGGPGRRGRRPASPPYYSSRRPPRPRPRSMGVGAPQRLLGDVVRGSPERSSRRRLYGAAPLHPPQRQRFVQGLSPGRLLMFSKTIL